MNITPLIDVLLGSWSSSWQHSPSSREGLTRICPLRHVQTTPPSIDDQVMIEYDADRRLAINHEDVSLADLEAKLRAIFQDRRDKTLYVAGAGSLRYGDVVDVIDAAKGAGVNRRRPLLRRAMRAAAR